MLTKESVHRTKQLYQIYKTFERDSHGESTQLIFRRNNTSLQGHNPGIVSCIKNFHKFSIYTTLLGTYIVSSLCLFFFLKPEGIF